MMKTVKCKTNGKSTRDKFLMAAKEGDLETIQQMLEVDKVVPVDCMHPYEDRTVLYAASSRGYVRVVQYLLQAGANINWVLLDGTTALHSACEEASSIAVVQELIQVGANIDAQDMRGHASHIALSSSHQ